MTPVSELATRRPSRLLRPLLMLLFLASLYGAAHYTGLTEHFSREDLRQLIERSGALGVVAFFFLFALGALLHIPAMVFIGAGILAYGALWGGIISFFAGFTAMVTSFLLVRTVGGQVLVEIEQPWVRRMLKQIDDRPIMTVIALRTVLWVSPPLNYALAMSGIRFRDFVVASGLGLVVPMFFISLFFGWLFE